MEGYGLDDVCRRSVVNQLKSFVFNKMRWILDPLTAMSLSRRTSLRAVSFAFLQQTNYRVEFLFLKIHPDDVWRLFVLR
jgi:hypothetical protein